MAPEPSPHRLTAPGAAPEGARAPVRIASVPVFAPVAIQLLHIVSQENIGLDKLAALIRADPALSLEVLRLANSPLFGARREITGILHALAMLGLNRIRAMVMTVAVRDFLSPARSSASFAPCWRHSLATAFLAEELAAGALQDRDACYTAGLLHEVGQLALIAARPADYDAMVCAARAAGASLDELEREWFGIDRHGLGLQLARAWKLPRPLCDILDPAAPRSGVAGLVHTACATAAMIGFGVGPSDGEQPASPPEGLDELLAAVATKINTVECSLAMV